MKYYKCQNEYFPTENVPQLESDTLLLDMSSKGRYSIPVRNLEYWEKRAHKLVAINSHADFFSSAAYLCLQQESMSVSALSRLLEAVAKSVKHTIAMSTILATELFQARCDAAIATLKLLLDDSSHELRNAPINSRQLFDYKIKEVAKSNYKAQQKFLASSSTNVNTVSNNNKNHLTRLQDHLRNLDSRPNLTDLNRTNRTGLKLILSPLRPVQGRTFLRGVVTQSSSPPLNMPRLPQSSESQPFPLPILQCPDIPVGRRLAHFVEQWGEITKQMGPLYHTRQFQDTITKIYLYNFDPLKPHFYIVKQGFTGVYIIFLILLKQHRLWVLIRTTS